MGIFRIAAFSTRCCCRSRPPNLTPQSRTSPPFGTSLSLFLAAKRSQKQQHQNSTASASSPEPPNLLHRNMIVELANSSSRLSCSLYIAHHASHRLLRTSPLLRDYASVMPSHASPRLLSHIPPAIHHRPSAITSTACDSPSEIYAHAASKPSVVKRDCK